MEDDRYRHIDYRVHCRIDFQFAGSVYSYVIWFSHLDVRPIHLFSSLRMHTISFVLIVKKQFVMI